MIDQHGAHGDRHRTDTDDGIVVFPDRCARNNLGCDLVPVKIVVHPESFDLLESPTQPSAMDGEQSAGTDRSMNGSVS